MCHPGEMLELSILGFLAAGPLPGHELRRRITHLTGYSRPVSDGTLYPAINRLTKAGLIERRPAPEAGGGRYVLNLTDTGREDMLRRLREAGRARTHRLPPLVHDPGLPLPAPGRGRPARGAQALTAFLEESASFFYDGETPLRAEEVADPYRRGMLLTARATSQAERTWIRESLGQDTPGPGPTRDPHASSPLDASAS